MVILGAMVDDSDEGNESVTADQISRFNTNQGKNLGVVYFTNKWAIDGVKFPLEKANIVKSFNATPMVRIQNSEDPDGAPKSGGKYSHKNIIDGKWNAELKQYALDVKSFGEIVCLEYGTEINGGWFSWSDEGPEMFKKAFQHLVNLFHIQNVSNVRWVFHVDATDNPNSKKWYPGDNYVDIIGTSCYGGPNSPNEKGEGCISALTKCYKNFSNISKNKMLAILEWGLGDPEDTRKTFEVLHHTFPRIKILQLWNEKVIAGHSEDYIPDGRIDVTPENLKAFREGAANPAYRSSYP